MNQRHHQATTPFPHISPCSLHQKDSDPDDEKALFHFERQDRNLTAAHRPPLQQQYRQHHHPLCTHHAFRDSEIDRYERAVDRCKAVPIALKEQIPGDNSDYGYHDEPEMRFDDLNGPPVLAKGFLISRFTGAPLGQALFSNAETNLPSIPGIVPELLTDDLRKSVETHRRRWTTWEILDEKQLEWKRSRTYLDIVPKLRQYNFPNSADQRQDDY